MRIDAPPTRALRIAAVGEICLDTFDPEGDAHLGGISVNFARAAADAGAEATVFAAVGDDAIGRDLRALLGAVGLTDAFVRLLPGASTQQRVRVSASGERILCGFVAGVAADYAPTDADLDAIAGSDAVAVPWSRETEAMIGRVLDACARVTTRPRLVCDVSIDSEAGDDPRAWVAPVKERFDLVFVGGKREHLAPLTDAARTARGLVVLTAGADGAFAITKDGVHHAPAQAKAIVDTLGCGDAFQGAFVAKLLAGASVDAALTAGARAAAIVAARRGA